MTTLEDCKDQFHPKCALCGDSGEIVAVHRKLGTTYGFRCKCEKASKHPGLPEWKDEMKAVYLPDYRVKANPKHRPGTFMDRSQPTEHDE